MPILFAQSGLLKWFVGDDPQHVGTPKIQWMNLPESWGVFVLLLIVGLIAWGVFWLYRHEIKTAPPLVKRIMAVLRLAVLLLLVLLYLKPSVYYQQISEIKPAIVVLRDSSLSLARGDIYRDAQQPKKLAALTGLPAEGIADGSIPRSDLINKAFASDPGLLQQLRDKGNVRIVDFADRPTAIDLLSSSDSNSPDDVESSGDSKSEARPKFPPLTPDGSATDLWQALGQVLDDNAQISSIVVVSEGQHNGSENPLEMADRAGAMDIPIYAVGVGDSHPPKNLSVSEVYVRSRTYPDEPFEVESVVQTSRRDETGLPAELNVELVQQRVDSRTGKLAGGETVSSKRVNVPENGGRVRVDFQHVVNVPGKYVYTVRVPKLDDETQTDDNELASSEMEVVDEKVKVLLISGTPNWDYQQVYRLLQRDQTIELSCWLQSMDSSRTQEGDLPISRLPRTIEELGQYNIVMMIDPNPDEFDDEWMELLRDFTKYKAGGVLFMAGPQFTSEFITLSRLSLIREILPVTFGDFESIDVRQALALTEDTVGEKMLVVPSNLDHPVMSFLADRNDNEQIWDLMPGLYWSFPATDAKPTARVLIEKGSQRGADANQPLLVSGRYGAGSILYFGFEGTWRWRPVGLQAQYFDRFWIQVVRFLVETRSLQGSRRGFIDREKTEYELGEKITLMARVLDDQFQPLAADAVEAVLTSDDGREQKVRLKQLPQQPGRFQGSFPASRIGSYLATIDLGTSDEKLIDPIDFRVVAPSAESSSYWLNEKMMRDIAARSGGEYLPLEQLAELPGKLPAEVQPAEFNSPPEPLWDISPLLRWLVFGLPVVLLSIEWALRKWYKLL